jgi:hypothetical protein
LPTEYRIPKERNRFAMSAIKDPLELAEAVAVLRLTPKADQRLQELMDRNTNGLLSEAEREDLEALAEMSESISLLRAKALHLLGRKPT